MKSLCIEKHNEINVSTVHLNQRSIDDFGIVIIGYRNHLIRFDSLIKLLNTYSALEMILVNIQ